MGEGHQQKKAVIRAIRPFVSFVFDFFVTF